MKRNYANLAAPQVLSDSINDAAQTLTVGSTTSFPDPPFLLGIDRGTAAEEVCLCTDKDSTTFTVTRGYDGTTAVPHALGAVVEHTVAAIDYRESGIVRVTTAERDAFGGADLWAGRTIFNLDTNRLQVRVGSSWRLVGAATGTISAFGGTEIPVGTLLCNGQAVSRTTYADLFGVIGTNFGSGNGSSTFNLPDLRERFAVGASSGDGYNLSDTGGVETVTLTTDQIPSHTHTTPNHSHSMAHTHGMAHTHAVAGTTGGQSQSHTHSGSTLAVTSQTTGVTAHVHQGGVGTLAQAITPGGAGGTGSGFISGSTGETSQGHTHTYSTTSGASSAANTGASSAANTGNASPTTNSTGGGMAHENRPPFLAVNFVIYT